MINYIVPLKWKQKEADKRFSNKSMEFNNIIGGFILKIQI